MNHFTRGLRYAFIVIALLAVFIASFLILGWPSIAKNVEYGATFSRPYARDDFGLDPDTVLAAALDDLGIRRFRIPAYWGILQPSEHEWNFDELDRDIRAIGDREGSVVLAIGEKLPRWPECWGPEWWKTLPRAVQRPATLKYIEMVVRRYRDNPTVIAWQIENEPHFTYGDCPTPERSFIRQEIELARALDPTRPVVTTDSGELSLWATFGREVDALGVSVYRVVQSPIFGIWRYWFVPPYLYERKALLLKPFGVRKVYVSEFQMEPWSNRRLPDTPLDEQFKTFDLAQMRSNFRFAERMHLSPVDFWGIEWWYWMKETQGHPEFWEEAKRFLDERAKTR
ncbi:beta-galactosidase [Candidatus Uhrbacteria bacterium]|nr:beta-galactosidase [Candidatus Uhrbacteria bacterium]